MLEKGAVLDSPDNWSFLFRNKAVCWFERFPRVCSPWLAEIYHFQGGRVCTLGCAIQTSAQDLQLQWDALSRGICKGHGLLEMLELNCCCHGARQGFGRSHTLGSSGTSKYLWWPPWFSSQRPVLASIYPELPHQLCEMSAVCLHLKKCSSTRCLAGWSCGILLPLKDILLSWLNPGVQTVVPRSWSC